MSLSMSLSLSLPGILGPTGGGKSSSTTNDDSPSSTTTSSQTSTTTSTSTSTSTRSSTSKTSTSSSTSPTSNPILSTSTSTQPIIIPSSPASSNTPTSSHIEIVSSSVSSAPPALSSQTTNTINDGPTSIHSVLASSGRAVGSSATNTEQNTNTNGVAVNGGGLTGAPSSTGTSTSANESATSTGSSSTLSPFSSMSPSTRIGAIAGVSVGVFLLLVLLALGAVYAHRRKRFRQNAIGHLTGYGYGAVALGERNSRDRDLLDGEGFNDQPGTPGYRDDDDDPFGINDRPAVVHPDTPLQPTLPRLQVRNGMASQVSIGTRAETGSMFREEEVWSRPSESSILVDPILESSRDVDLSGIIEHVMGPRPDTSMTANSGFVSTDGGGSGSDGRGSRMGLLANREEGGGSPLPPAYSPLPRITTPPPPRPPRAR